MKKSLFSLNMALLVSGLVLLTGCREEPDKTTETPLISELSITEITASSVLVTGVILTEGSSPVVKRGFSWSRVPEPADSDDRLVLGAGKGSFTGRIPGLLPGTEYYVRSYATNLEDTYYGESMLIKTPSDVTEPTVVTRSPEKVSFSSVLSGGEITDIGGGEITERGVCWNTEPEPTIDYFKLVTASGSASAGKGNFALMVTGLLPGKQYYLRAYAINSAGISYGPEISFRTLAILGTRITQIPDGISFLSVAFSIRNKVYVGSGWEHWWDLEPVNDFREWDFETNSWRQLADFPGSNSSPRAFAIGNKGYVITTGNPDSEGRYVYEFWEYDPAVNIWQRKSDFPSGVSRHNPVMFAIGSKGYIGMGQSLTENGSQSIFLNDLWEWNQEADVWTRKTDFPGQGRYGAVTFVIGTNGYVCAEIETTSYALSASELWEYDQTSDRWARKTDLPGGVRGWPTGLTVGNKGYVGAGESISDDWHENHSIWEWDQATDSWTKIGILGLNTYPSIGGKVGDIGYVISEFSDDLTYREIWTFPLKTEN